MTTNRLANIVPQNPLELERFYLDSIRLLQESDYTLAEVAALALAALTKVIHDSTLTGDGTVASPLGVAEVVLTTLYDDTGVGNISYVGYAEPGTATSAALWRIKKLDLSGGDVVMTWANGDALFNNVWDNRAALSYS